MKKTNKTFKRFAAITSASLLAACAMAPVFTSMTSNAASITINGISASQEHQFKVYQIFTGEITQQTVGSGESATTVDILSKLKWGSGVSAYKTNATATAEGVDVGDDVPETFSESLTSMDARAVVELLTFKETETIYTSEGTSLTIPGLADGYYYIEDVSDFSNADESNSAWIVQVAKDATIAIKNAMPSIDKQVWDNEGETWDETADWNINDKYMSDETTPVQQAGFKLIATVPQDEDLAYYDSYKLIFNDSMSNGVTYDGIRSVTISDANGVIATITDGYEVAGVTNGDAGKSWTLTIEDLKSKLPVGVTLGSRELKVEVIYNAHLNQYAIVHNGSNGENGQVYKDGTTVNVNNNSVYLEYSNNPDATGGGTSGDDTGKTTEDTVGVFTYQVINTKYAESEEGDKLSGAKFKLFSDSACTQEIFLDKVDVNGSIYYVPGGSSSLEMESDENGLFNIHGLDAGTYYVKETVAPEGYNLIKEAKEIVIGATHSEVGGTSAKLNLGENTLSYNYVNKAGTQLPGTGGIGTTIFYLGGGAMAAIGGIYLISKRRMRKSEE